VTIKPQRVILRGPVGAELSKKVIIIPETPVPFKIMKVAQMHSTNFRTTLKEIEKSGKKAYELTVENMVKKAGKYHDQINIITDRSDFMPLTIRVDGYIDAIDPQTGKPAPAVKIKPEPESTPPKMVIVPPSKPVMPQPSKPESAPVPTPDGNSF